MNRTLGEGSRGALPEARFLHFHLTMGEAMQERNLQDLFLAYRSSGKGRELIMERVAALVYNSHAKFGFDDEDDAANALLKFRDG